MYSFFVMRGMRAFAREWLAAAIALTLGSIAFGLMCLKFSASDEGAAFVAAALVALPSAIMILQGIRTGKMRLPRATVAKSISQEGEVKETVGSFMDFWRSLDPEERQGLQWLSSMMAANALNEFTEAIESPIGLHPGNIEEFEKAVRTKGSQKVLLPMKGGENRYVKVMVEHRGGRIVYSLEPKDA